MSMKYCQTLVLQHNKYVFVSPTSRTTVTSARIPEEDACHRARNFSHVQKRNTAFDTLVGCIMRATCVFSHVQKRNTVFDP